MIDWVTKGNDMLADNCLFGWHTEISRGKHTVGLCRYSKKTIYISKHFIANEPESKVMDTLIHEVAHALTPGHGHDSTWKNTAIHLGGTGSTYADAGNYGAKWEFLCINGHETYKYRWNKRTTYQCHCGSLLYPRRSDGTRETYSSQYVNAFNRLARARSLPEIDRHGLLAA